jgi:tellurite resistance protein TehA-like permease
VFPLGMYAASSFVVGSVVGIGALSDFASVWTWVAFAAWAAVLAAMLVREISPRPAERA